MKQMLVNFILSGAGISIILLVLARIVPNDKMRAVGYAAGAFLTTLGARKLGRATWDKIEVFIKNSLGVLLDGFDAGLLSDSLPPPSGASPTDPEKKA